MRALRYLSAAVLIGAMGFASAHSSSTAARPPLAALCSPTALTQNLTYVRSVANFGCEGKWAFVWANIDVAEHMISVTEVMRFDPGSKEWVVASRLKVCKPSILPTFVYRQGCFSN